MMKKIFIIQVILLSLLLLSFLGYVLFEKNDIFGSIVEVGFVVFIIFEIVVLIFKRKM